MPAALCFRGPLNVDALQGAMEDLVARHEALRTTFAERDGEPVQIVAPTQEVTIARTDLRGLPPEEAQAAVHRWIETEALRSPDLHQGPLLRVRLLQVADDEHVLALVQHHLISDWWSVTTLFAEFTELYEARIQARRPALPPLLLQYGILFAPSATDDGHICCRRPGVLDAATGRRPAEPRDPHGSSSSRNAELPGASHHFRIPADVVDQLAVIGQEHGATLFMVLLSLYKLLLFRHTGQDDVVVGVPVANREDPDVEGVIGFL
ncbi:MAG: condensation domain-containing protein [Tessaracoccus sp.]